MPKSFRSKCATALCFALAAGLSLPRCAALSGGRERGAAFVPSSSSPGRSHPLPKPRGVGSRSGERCTSFVSPVSLSWPSLFGSARDAGAEYDDDDDEIDIDDDEDDDDLMEPPPAVTSLEDDFADSGFGPVTSASGPTRTEAESLTVKALKQQLRLRGLKTSGRKSELVDRLLGVTEGEEGEPERGAAVPLASLESLSESDIASVIDPNTGEAVEASEAFGEFESAGEKASDRAARARAEPIDVEAYLDEDDRGKDFKSSDSGMDDDGHEADASDESGQEGSGPEVWGASAKIVDDYEGRSPVVDSISRTVIEYRGFDCGNNQTSVNAYVAASRYALRAYLSGGREGWSASQRGMSSKERAAREVRDVQTGRENEARVQSGDFADVDWAPDGGDDMGHYDAVLSRDYGDWGAVSVTGAQVSAREVAGVLLLSDVYGYLGEDTRALADKVAFECQPVVVVVPDLFRGDPWEEDSGRPGFDLKGRTYEEWRDAHDEERVNVDIRAAAATLRERYGVSAVAVFGQCFGGGRALEAAAGWVPSAPILNEADSKFINAKQNEGPPLVDPAACVAWYPTRYDAQALFGPESPLCPPSSASEDDSNTGSDEEDDSGKVAVMALFASEDVIPGARRGDAEMLKYCLEHDPRVKDCMVKIFPGTDHGFAHQGMAQRRGEGDQLGNESDEKDDFLEEEFGVGAGFGDGNGGGDAEVAALLSTAFMETYARVFLPTTGVPIKDDFIPSGSGSDDGDEDSGDDSVVADPSWGRDIEMKDLSYAKTRNIRREIEEAVRTHEDAKPDLSRMPDYQYFNEIDDMETLEDLPRENWEDKFREAVEDLKRVGVDPTKERVRKGEDGGAERRRDSPEEYLKRMKDAYDKGELKSWLADVDMDAPFGVDENGEVVQEGGMEMPSANRIRARAYGDDFTAKFMDAMKDLREQVVVSPDDDVHVALSKFKAALDDGKLKKLLDVKKIRDARIAAEREADGDREELTRTKLRELGIDNEEDSMDDKFRKLKEAYDRGETEGLEGLPLGAFVPRDRRDRGDEWEADSKDGGLW